MKCTLNYLYGKFSVVLTDVINLQNSFTRIPQLFSILPLVKYCYSVCIISNNIQYTYACIHILLCVCMSSIIYNVNYLNCLKL